jgi:hypothetical protein
MRDVGYIIVFIIFIGISPSQRYIMHIYDKYLLRGMTSHVRGQLPLAGRANFQRYLRRLKMSMCFSSGANHWHEKQSRFTYALEWIWIELTACSLALPFRRYRNKQHGTEPSRMAVPNLRDQSINSYIMLLKNNSITSVQ